MWGNMETILMLNVGSLLALLGTAWKILKTANNVENSILIMSRDINELNRRTEAIEEKQRESSEILHYVKFKKDRNEL